jgi:ribosome-associated toxin RatA of RatAB toxin-antitoxin module
MMIAAYIVMGLVGLFFIVPALMPGKYNVEKSTVINKSPDHVFNNVADLNHYRDWNPWQKMEPGAKAEITGTPKTVGHKFFWEGKKIGSGSLTVRSLNAPSDLQLDLAFIKPWKTEALDSWTFEKQSENSTKVTWKNSGPLPYPMARLMGPMVVKNLNQQFEQGLKSLKEMCEK